MKDLEDQNLVRRALAADPESFGELCRRYYPSLVAVADSILLDHHLAEDAAQETLAAACRQLAGLKKPERFGTWIAAICRNVARDMRRQLQRERRSIAAGGNRESECHDREQDAVLSEALQQLPQPLREVIYLRFYNEMSYRQMGNVLGITEQVIDGRIRRAKKKMAVFIKKSGFRK
ncbi:MAG: sigma-70 family RNA polymerase sigma factor [Sedimentisphaerales bacterium]|nr:sigma-70 family RNA polymerase sigma factor [Sedimentisphaerales bacterium]